MTDMISAPSLFSFQDIYKSAYRARIQEFTNAGQNVGLKPAYKDSEKIAVILVDYQYDFIDPEGALYVPGAQDDIVRFLKWFYMNAHKITSVYASMDTHLPFQIFFSSWWHNPKTKVHPQSFTTITTEDISKEIWVPVFQVDWSIQYVHLLKQRLKKDLMIWPYHAMEGTVGYTLSTPISEAIAWHSAARNTQPTYIAKGRTLRSEYYGIFGAEIPDPEDPESGINVALLDAIMKHDRIYVAGEAKSHCVLESEKQIFKHFGNKQELLGRLHFLRDCTSSVKHPIVDFDAQAEAELAIMVQQGIQMVLSTDMIQ
jgi:nicotinamidase/pyrazinamidase